MVGDMPVPELPMDLGKGIMPSASLQAYGCSTPLPAMMVVEAKVAFRQGRLF